MIESVFSDHDAELFCSYGFTQYYGNQLPEAIETFRLLCARRPNEAKYWFALGGILQEAKEYQKAIEAWAFAALLNGADPYPEFYAAECYFALQDPLNGLKNLKKASLKADHEPDLKAKIAALEEQWS
jgi:tetratricopeptide (TPR) repeat protein